MAEEKRKPIETSPGFGLMTKESLMPVSTKGARLFIGIPKEKTFQENRVSLTPESIAVLVSNGHRVVVESKAGEGSSYFDTDFSEAGAEIAEEANEVFKADIIVKSAPLAIHEIGMMHMNQIIISPIHLPMVNEKYLHELMNKRITALAFEYIKDNSKTFPIVRSMSEIAGNASILIAAEYLSNMNQGKGILLGGIAGVPPANVVILGAGVVGQFAARTALGLGAIIKVFDNSIYKLMRLQNNLGQRVFTSVISPTTLMDKLEDADVAIGAIHSETGRAPIVVTEEMVSNMKAGSVIIDVSIDQGGCFETSEVTTHTKPVFKKYDVIHYCVPNIASRVPRTASSAISNVISPLLLEASAFGGFDKFLVENVNLRHGVYIYKGSLTNRNLSQMFSLKFTDLELIFASSI
jgi:alanine dehydrogenase